jgi:aminopeptidase
MSLQKAAEKILKDIIVLKTDESFLIVTDENKKDIANAFFTEGKKITKNSKLIKTPIARTPGEEPPKEIADEMLKYDVELLITTKSLTHTKAANIAAKQGAKIATMPGILEETIIRFSEADINLMNSLGKKLDGLIKKVDNIRVITEKGTDLRFSVTRDRKFYDYSSVLNKKGSIGNIPLGEVCCRIPDENANGKVVIDLSVLDELISEPITVTIKDNYAVDITGGRLAEKLKKILDEFGKMAFFIAEFGIGTNNSAKIIGNVLEDEKVLGTFHIAFGSNISFGGSNDVPIHIDGIVDKPTIFFDDEKIMEKGKFLI